MKKIIFTVMIYALTIPITYAGGQSGAVSRIYPHGDTIYFRVKGDECKTSANNKYWYFKLTHTAGNAWMAMLLAAATSGKPISFAYSGSCNDGIDEQITYIYQDF